MSLSEVTELRIHGVSGTPPESILRKPHVQRVAGNDLAGFYRPSEGGSPTHGAGGPRLEGYSWGNLTSGASARALWLLLLPFMLVNLASWMRPRRSRPEARWHVRAGEKLVLGLCRLLALTLTATVVLTAVGLAMDLVAWQCVGPDNECAEGRSYLQFLTKGYFSEPGPRVAVGAIVPLLTIGVLWALGRRTWQRYEWVESPGPETGQVSGSASAANLDDAGFWYGRHLVGRLRTLHLVVGLSTVVAALCWPAFRFDQETGSGLAWLGRVLLSTAVLLVLVSAVSVLVPRVVDRTDDRRVPLQRTMRLILMVLVPAAFTYAMLSRGSWKSTGALPGFTGGVTRLFAVQMTLLVLLALAVWLLRGGSTPEGAALRGFATPLVAGLALFLQSAFTAGLSFRLADWLDRGGAVPNPAVAAPQEPIPAAALEPPVPYAWAGLGFLLAVLLLLFVLVPAVLVRWRRLVAAAEKQVRGDYGLGSGHLPDRVEDRVKEIARVVGAAELTNHVGPLLALALIPASLAAAAMTVLVLFYDDAPVDRAGAGTWQAVMLSFATNAGAYLIGAFAIALVVLGRMAYKTPSIRRVVGILWDIGTFWPRDAHPLAPPCYAERAVPDLVTRTSWLAAGDPERCGVILAGHSQGSVLAAATVLQLNPGIQQRLALFTYGSPLTALYGAYFPAYFSQQELAAVRQCVTSSGQPARWVNLYLDTDPIGGPVRLRGIDHRILPVRSFARQPGDTVDSPVLGHSDYPATPQFDAAADQLAITIGLCHPPPAVIDLAGAPADIDAR